MFKNLMRTILFVCVFMTMTSSCNNDEGVKMIASNEFTVTIASRKLPGLVQIDNREIPRSVFAVKKDRSQDWEPLPYIFDFDYEPGYEYKMLVKEFSYADNSNKTDTWKEYERQIISKERTESRGLPESFITGSEYGYYPIEVSYKIDASEKEVIEEAVKNNPDIPWNCSVVISNTKPYTWTLFNEFGFIVKAGYLRLEQISSIPEAFKDFLPETQIILLMQWIFDYYENNDKSEYSYFTIITDEPEDAGIINPWYNGKVWLFKDWTQYYLNKYSEAGVNKVLVRLSLR